MYAAGHDSPAALTGKHETVSTRKDLLAVLSGIMLTVSFPPGGCSFFAWFALVPLLKCIDNETPFQSFKFGAIAGIAHFLTLIYWIVVVLECYGGLNIFLSLGPLLLLSLYLALYPALFSCLTSCLRTRRFFLTFMAACWVALEYLRSMLLTGFPWCLLGYSQYENLHIIQIADLFGVFGISFLILLINGLIYCLLFRHNDLKNTTLRLEILFIIVPAAIGTLIYGHYRLAEDRAEICTNSSINVLLVQANIDQSIKWDQAYQRETVDTYRRLTTMAACNFKPDLIVWPETSVPFFFQDNLGFSQKIISLAKELNADLIFGSPAYKRMNGKTMLFNRAYLLSRDDQWPQYHDKVHLVPFGEYIPLKWLLFFVNRLVPAAGDFSAGAEIKPLKTGSLSAGVLICFEAIFPDLARTHVKGGANILVNLTNDAWFGMTSAPYQHLCMAVFRAIENRMPVIRAANTGISALIEPTGKIALRSALFQTEVLKAVAETNGRHLTFYTLYGDIFAIFLLLISIIRIFSCLTVGRGAR